MQLINDHMQNRKQYNILKAQLVIADLMKNAFICKIKNLRYYGNGDY